MGAPVKGMSVAGPEIAWSEGPAGAGFVKFFDGHAVTQITFGEGFGDLPVTDGHNVYWLWESGWHPNNTEIAPRISTIEGVSRGR